MYLLNDWHDYGRVLILAVSLWCCYKLSVNYKNHSHAWTVKTKDLWYAVFMWALVGVVQPAQGILLDRPLTPAFVVISAAVLVTGKGLHQRGPWGDDGE